MSFVNDEQTLVGGPCTAGGLIECVDVCLHISMCALLHS